MRPVVSVLHTQYLPVVGGNLHVGVLVLERVCQQEAVPSVDIFIPHCREHLLHNGDCYYTGLPKIKGCKNSYNSVYVAHGPL